MSTRLIPYLNFIGQSKAAMEFYHSIFGGKLDIQTYKNADFPHDPKDDDKVIHASLDGEVVSLMASDGNDEHPVTPGDNVHLSFMGTDEALLTNYFNVLADGGKIDMPLAKQFWGDTYGQLTDKFGIHWTVNISTPQR